MPFAFPNEIAARQSAQRRQQMKPEPHGLGPEPHGAGPLVPREMIAVRVEPWAQQAVRKAAELGVLRGLAGQEEQVVDNQPLAAEELLSAPAWQEPIVPELVPWVLVARELGARDVPPGFSAPKRHGPHTKVAQGAELEARRREDLPEVPVWQVFWGRVLVA